MQLSNKQTKITYFLIIPFIIFTAIISRTALIAYFILVSLVSIGLTINEVGG